MKHFQSAVKTARELRSLISPTPIHDRGCETKERNAYRNTRFSFFVALITSLPRSFALAAQGGAAALPNEVFETAIKLETSCWNEDSLTVLHNGNKHENLDRPASEPT